MFSSRKKFLIIYWTAYTLFISFYMYQAKKEEYKNSEKITATVIDRIESTARRKRYFYPQFQFSYNDSIYINADRLYWTREKRPGEKMTVIFPKGNPEKAVAYTFVSYWIYLPALLISLVIFLFVFAVIVYFKWKDNWSYLR